jgi:putative RNA 2'-phosphotransferase
MNRRVRISKTLSYWLRHAPGDGGLALDESGWAEVGAVLDALARTFDPPVSRGELEEVVATSDKRRFAVEGGRIRASQGHSVEVDLGLRPVEPPRALYHGTTRERWERIRRSGGLAKMRRHHVHLSGDVETARRVGERHRREDLLVLRVDAAAMRRAGHEFFVSDNGVYLTDRVPLEFLEEERGGSRD